MMSFGICFFLLFQGRVSQNCVYGKRGHEVDLVRAAHQEKLKRLRDCTNLCKPIAAKYYDTSIRTINALTAN